MRYLTIFGAILLVVCAASAPALADLMDDVAALRLQAEELQLDAYGHRATAEEVARLLQSWQGLESSLADQAARNILHAAKLQGNDPAEVARFCGEVQGRLQQIAALEMIEAQSSGNISRAQEWRALISLPRHANSTEGALALQRLGSRKKEAEAVSALLSRDFLTWQNSRIREKLDALHRSITAGHASTELFAARVAEIDALVHVPAALYTTAKVPEPASTFPSQPSWEGFLSWRSEVESALPNLLTPDEVHRRERLLLKLLKLVPIEYHSGIRNGEIVIPIEYREAQMFTVQAQQIVNELRACWRTTRADAFAAHSSTLDSRLQNLEELINRKAENNLVERAAADAAELLREEFGLSLQRSGEKSDVIEETALEIRTTLTQSLAAAKAGRRAEAESLRLDAYTTFDVEIEARVLPRDPHLAMAAERSFLDGSPGAIGIKAALDARLTGTEIDAAYGRTLQHLEECISLLRVNLSPGTVAFTTVTVIAREGLEAVVVLAALLAGFRGAQHAYQRRLLVRGAWLAIAASALTFWLSRTLIKSLSSYGETLEAVVSILAVIVLLMVTNWVFHKVYWVKWNAKLRELSRAVENSSKNRWEWLGLLGVGFLTMYREGFEISLFMQSLILEGGTKPVATGFAIGAGIVALAGVAVFLIGAKLPYRKLLVITGVLVVAILLTFVGSTVRILQTVGWIPVHPVDGLELPTWAGLWLGLYPSWEGLVIPFLALGYVVGAWAWVKWRASLAQKPRTAAESELSSSKWSADAAR
jgi:high-affinity iron transporter